MKKVKYIKTFESFTNEQASILSTLGRMPETGQDVYGVGSNYDLDNTDFDKSLLKLFANAKGKTHASVPDHKNLILKLYNAMNGVGTTESTVIQVLSSLKNINELATILANWESVTKSSESLYKWLIGDMDAESVWRALGKWKLEYAVNRPSTQVYSA